MKGNKYIFKDDYAELIINSQKYGLIKVKIDIEDIERCNQITWHYSNSRDIPYVSGKVKNKNIKLHRYLLNLNDKRYVVDHINRDSLDNRKSNLRIADYQENSFNRSLRSDNSSGFAGVNYNKVTNKWRAKIRYNNIDIHLGYFKDINEALINRTLAEEYLFKDFKPTRDCILISNEIVNKAKINVVERIFKKVS